MASKNVLNLTLDEIIQRKRKQSTGPVQFGRARKGVRINRINQPLNVNKKNLSWSMSNRLSRGGIKNFNVGFQRNGVIPNQVQVRTENRRNSVHSRLTLNKAFNVHSRLTSNKKSQHPVDSRNLLSRSLVRNRNIKTRHSEDFKPVRITNGAIVKGLRSDQLLLQKLNQRRNYSLQDKVERLRELQSKRARIAERNGRDTLRRGAVPKVSMNFNHGLTVSISNQVARRPRPSARVERRLSPSSISSSSSDESYPVRPSTSKRSPDGAKDQVSSILRLGLERPPPPKPHRQVLDPLVQKEIAALQGHAEPASGGPGPGVKGFKMLPTRTRHSLNERFTIERNTVAE